MANNSSTFDNDESNDLKIAINSIQRTYYVARLYINKKAPGQVIPYDWDNLYPNKIKAIAQRSGTTISSIGTLSSFIRGEGFEGMKTAVNEKNDTFWKVLKFIADEIAMFGGVALHVNYNLLYQITEINPVNFEFVRWYKDKLRHVVSSDWQRYNQVKDDEIYNPFNPDPEVIAKEIEQAGGIENYSGQLLYWIPNIADLYTVCTWDAALDDAQFEAEAKLYGLSSIQNDYSLGGFAVYPKNLVSKEEVEKAINEVKKDIGGKNAGGVRLIPAPAVENLANWKWFVPISRNNIDNLHTHQKEDAKFNIYAAFRQPPILNGVATSGMFNEESFLDAFNYYNASTETERKDVEDILNKIIRASIWAGLGDIQIIPKKYMARNATTKQPETTQQQATNDTLTNLTGRQLQGGLRIVNRYKKGELTYDQAVIMLSDGFGFSDEQIEIWLDKE